jgi:NADPH:quinone reductase-like Zn-dependent oxidoreductase
VLLTIYLKAIEIGCELARLQKLPTFPPVPSTKNTAGLPLFAAGKLKPIVGKTFRLSESIAAHLAMEAGGGFGKTILVVSD